MQIKKEKAINLISLGLALKYIPLITLAVFVENINKSHYILYFLISGLFLLGYTLFVQGCRLYTQSKGYSSNWGWLGLLSIFCLLIILLIPVNEKLASHLISNKKNNSPFDTINILELFVLSLVAVGVVFIPALILYLLDSLNFSVAIIEESSTFNLENIFCTLIFGSILLIKLQESGLKIVNLINFKNNVNLKLILFVTIVSFGFDSGFNSVALYNLSFLFPNYVEYYINEKYFNNTPDLLLFSILAILLAPIIEELFFRGIILQKWSAKCGVRLGFLTSSLLFAVLHLSSDIISIFIISIMLSVLYFKTRNLLTPILCHCFYNISVTIFHGLYVFSKSPTEREAFISVSDYQTSIQPLLGQKVLLVALTLPLIVYFLYKYFPKNNAILPYADSGS